MSFVIPLRDLDRTCVALAGGKGASLGELMHVPGVHVPDGFVVTTEAFTRSRASSGDNLAVAPEVVTEIRRALQERGEDAAYAVRSSATSEDAASTSFAGQHDTFLDIRGEAAVVDSIRRCWMSLFTDRAVAYRARVGIDPQHIAMAVVVQQMASASAAGVMFTADPLTGNRTVISIEAAPGLGEMFVAGHANADVYRVRADEILERELRHARPVLEDSQVRALCALGRVIEAHFGAPQDVEWCLTPDGRFAIVQSRPITTLFPVPAGAAGNRVYISVGHQQMMTDAMKPLGLSFWQMTTPAPMAEAGSRLFVDVTMMLAAPASRTALLQMAGRSDPLIADALQTIVDREGFLPAPPEQPARMPAVFGPTPEVETDPAIVAALVAETDASIREAERTIHTNAGQVLLDFIRTDLQELKRLLFQPANHRLIMAGMEAMWWLRDHLQLWLGEAHAADTLAQSVDSNVTAEMGLALLDVADAIRPHRQVVAFLQSVDDDDFLEALRRLPGGPESRAAIAAWLDRYGMRGPGEIDITRPRWRERPSMLLRILLEHVAAYEPGESRRRFEKGLHDALATRDEVLSRLRALPDGDRKAAEAERMIDRVRAFAGYREYPKYGKIRRYFLYKQALMTEAGRLAASGVLQDPEDIFFLRFEELEELFGTQRADAALIQQRRSQFHAHEPLRPPRGLTSEGEGLSGSYRRDDVPQGALAGLAVSPGIVEGRARIVFDIARAGLEPGDILVTTYTDPSWTPLFIGIAGLVTEVGGLMTHGAVIAREYGLPAVVGVGHATLRIRDGLRIRVHGAAGYVEILDQDVSTAPRFGIIQSCRSFGSDRTTEASRPCRPGSTISTPR